MIKIEEKLLADTFKGKDNSNLTKVSANIFTHMILPIHTAKVLEHRTLDVDAMRRHLVSSKNREAIIDLFSNREAVKDIIEKVTYSDNSKVISLQDHVVTYVGLYNIIDSNLPNQSSAAKYTITDLFAHYFNIIGIYRTDAAIKKVQYYKYDVNQKSVLSLLIQKDIDGIIREIPNRTGISESNSRRMQSAELTYDFLQAYSMFITKMVSLMKREKLVVSVLSRVRASLINDYGDLVEYRHIDDSSEKFDYIKHNITIAKIALTDPAITSAGTSQVNNYSLWQYENDVFYEMLHSDSNFFVIIPLVDIYKYIDVRTFSYDSSRAVVFGYKRLAGNSLKLFRKFTFNDYTTYNYENSGSQLTEVINRMADFDLSDVVINSLKEWKTSDETMVCATLYDSVLYTDTIMETLKFYLAVLNSDGLYLSDSNEFYFHVKIKNMATWLEKYKIILNDIIVKDVDVIPILADIDSYSSSSLQSMDLNMEPEKTSLYLSNELESFSTKVKNIDLEFILPATITASNLEENIKLDIDVHSDIFNYKYEIISYNSKLICSDLKNLIEYYRLIKEHSKTSKQDLVLASISHRIARIVSESFFASKDLARYIFTKLIIEATKQKKVSNRTGLYTAEMAIALYIATMSVAMESIGVFDQKEIQMLKEAVNTAENKLFLITQVNDIVRR